MKLNIQQVKRFWQKVNKKAPHECWSWTASKDGRGYGKQNINGSFAQAHRISYELNVGTIPRGLSVLHKCDNPPCVNPNHLFLGTHQDNIKDMWKKGRGRAPVFRGENHGNAKMTNEIVLRVRSARQKHGLKHRELAKKFGLPIHQISDILTRSWQHI